MKIFKHQRISLFLFLVLYRIAQEMYYVKFIVPIYSYAGYINDASLSRYIISWAFFIGMALLFIKAMFGKDRFWSNVSFVLLLLKFTPLTILLGYISYEKAYIVTNFIFWFMFVVLCNNMPSIKIVSDDFIEEAKISVGNFDNVGECQYAVPSHWDIGKVYKRLIKQVALEKKIDVVDAIIEVYHSFISDKIDDYNSSVYYENPSYIFECFIQNKIL